ncbi:MAG: chemotaxis protein CheW [Acidobacteria bacterium]|nr:chemotaxis protein CheW [Acidobacteriota bacterium]
MRTATATALASPATPQTEIAPRQFATFMLGNLLFGVEVLQVQEVIRYQPMTPVPLAPRTIQGLINLRGQIVTAIDMRRRLDLPERPGEARPMNVVVRTADGVVSLLVDEIGDVLEPDRDRYEPVPETVPTPVCDVVTGVYKLDGQLLLVLDVERAVQSEAGLIQRVSQ